MLCGEGIKYEAIKRGERGPRRTAAPEMRERDQTYQSGRRQKGEKASCHSPAPPSSRASRGPSRHQTAPTKAHKQDHCTRFHAELTHPNRPRAVTVATTAGRHALDALSSVTESPFLPRHEANRKRPLPPGTELDSKGIH